MLIAAAGCLFLPARAAFAKAQTDRLREALRDAGELFGEIRISRKKAFEKFEKALQTPGKRPDPTPEITWLNPEELVAKAYYNITRIEEFLERVCICQARLEDVRGAVTTWRKLGGGPDSRHAKAAYEIALAQVRIGKAADAVQTSKELRTASRITVMLAIARQRLDCAKTKEAKGWIDKTQKLITRSDSADRAHGYATLASWYWRLGKRSAAREALAEAVRAARDKKATVGWRAYGLTHVALAQKDMGNQSGAANTLDEIFRTLKSSKIDGDKLLIGKHWVLVRRIVRAMLRLSFSQRAVEAARLLDVGKDETSPVSNHRLWLYRDIALDELRKHEITGATALLKEIHYKPFRQTVLIALARAHAEVGDVKSALRVAAEVQATNGSKGAQAFLEVAAAQVRSGNAQGARKTATRTEFLHTGSHQKPVRFNHLIPATWGIDYSQKPPLVIWTVRPMGSPEGQADRAALAATAMRVFHILGHGGKYDKYHKDFETFPSLVVMQLAEAQAEIGNLSGALRWAERLSVARSKAMAILGAAEGYLARKKMSGTETGGQGRRKPCPSSKPGTGGG